jgi:hypothetical protein
VSGQNVTINLVELLYRHDTKFGAMCPVDPAVIGEDDQSFGACIV